MAQLKSANWKERHAALVSILQLLKEHPRLAPGVSALIEALTQRLGDNQLVLCLGALEALGLLGAGLNPNPNPNPNPKPKPKPNPNPNPNRNPNPNQVELCQRAGKSDADCSYARFLHVPPVPTNVTITAERLEPVIGATQVRVRAAVRLRNAGGTSPPVPSDVSLTLSGSMGRLGQG